MKRRKQSEEIEAIARGKTDEDKREGKDNVIINIYNYYCLGNVQGVAECRAREDKQ